MLTFRILGPLEVDVGEAHLDLGPPQQRAVLAVLILDANRVVPTVRLIEAVWGEDPPATARNLLQVYMSRLRRTLAPLAADGVRVLTRAPGYLLEVEPDRIDAERFVLLRRTDQAVPDERAATLREALALWRGAALADVAAHPGLIEPAARLEELRLLTIEDLLDADLALGRHAELAAELPGLIVDHPYRERLHAVLVLALYRSGRQAEALAAYRGACRRLREDLGLEPGPELRQLELAILRHDQDLRARPPRARTEGPPADDSTLTPPSRVARADRRPRRLHVAILVAVALAVTSSAALLARARDGPQQVRIGSGDIGFVDGSSGRLTRVVPAAGHGGPLAVAGGTAWAADQASKTVTSVDLAHGATQPYGLGIPPTAVAAAGGSVWIAGGFAGTLSRILPAGRFIGAPFRPTPTSTGRLALALDGRTLWVAGQDRRLVALDTGSLRVRRTVELPAGPRAIAAAAGAVWAVVYGDTRIVRIDAATGALRRGAELGHQPVALHAGRGGVWVATRGDNRVWRIDARTGHPVAAVPVGEQPTSLAVSAGSLWVGGIGGTVARIDPRSTALVGTVRLGVPIAGLAAGTGGVWVSVR